MADSDRKNDGEAQGATAEFPLDRVTVERLCEAFPRARWSDARKAWSVPGKTASKRIGSWLARLEAEADVHGDAKGRDAFEFDPIESPYLELGKAGFRIRAPYWRTVAGELREVRFARWDGDLRIWHVPFRSIENLRGHWKAIEAAAQRAEPEERKRRAEERKGSKAEAKFNLRSAERKKRRYPRPSDDLPPTDRAIAISYGIVVFTEITGDVVKPAVIGDFYQGVTDDHVWVSWRAPTLEELVRTPPAKNCSPSRTRVVVSHD